MVADPKRINGRSTPPGLVSFIAGPDGASRWDRAYLYLTSNPSGRARVLGSQLERPLEFAEYGGLARNEAIAWSPDR